jgi:hypothetical protein
LNSHKQKIVHIGDETYVINPFLTTKGLRVKAKLVKYLGSSLSAALSAEDEGTVVDLIAGVFAEITEDQYVELIKEILSNVTKNNMNVDFDKEFALNYGNLFKLVKEVLEFNYNDLFSLLGINVG